METQRKFQIKSEEKKIKVFHQIMVIGCCAMSFNFFVTTRWIFYCATAFFSLSLPPSSSLSHQHVMWTNGSNRITLADCRGSKKNSFAVFVVCILCNLCVLKPFFSPVFFRISCLDKLKFSLPPGFI
jgi:hypothetical protein